MSSLPSISCSASLVLGWFGLLYRKEGRSSFSSFPVGISILHTVSARESPITTGARTQFLLRDALRWFSRRRGNFRGGLAINCRRGHGGLLIITIAQVRGWSPKGGGSRGRRRSAARFTLDALPGKQMAIDAQRTCAPADIRSGGGQSAFATGGSSARKPFVRLQGWWRSNSPSKGGRHRQDNPSYHWLKNLIGGPMIRRQPETRIGRWEPSAETYSLLSVRRTGWWPRSLAFHFRLRGRNAVTRVSGGKSDLGTCQWPETVVVRHSAAVDGLGWKNLAAWQFLSRASRRWILVLAALPARDRVTRPVAGRAGPPGGGSGEAKAGGAAGKTARPQTDAIQV